MQTCAAQFLSVQRNTEENRKTGKSGGGRTEGQEPSSVTDPDLKPAWRAGSTESASPPFVMTQEVSLIQGLLLFPHPLLLVSLSLSLACFFVLFHLFVFSVLFLFFNVTFDVLSRPWFILSYQQMLVD